VLPLAEQGSLSDMMHCAGRALLPKELVLCFGDDLAGALDYVHGTLGMLHRDIKPANAVVDCAGRAVLIDFDRACPQGEQPGANRRKGPSGGRQKDCECRLVPARRSRGVRLRSTPRSLGSRCSGSSACAGDGGEKC
jgi:serine/threonine protein kinase